MHGSAGVAGRRGGEGREPEGRRSRPRDPGRARRRLVLFPDLQRQQEIAGDRPEVGGRQEDRPRSCRQGRRVRGELRARRDRAAGARLRRRLQDQSRHRLRPGEGLRRGQPVREQPGVRHDRTGGGRRDEHQRRARRPPDQARADAGRHRHRHAARHLHPGRALREEDHRQGPAHPDRHAGRDAALHPPRLRHAGPRGRPRQARRRSIDLGRQSALRHLSLQGRRAQRLRLRLHQPRQSRALEAAAGRDRSRGLGRRSALPIPQRARSTRPRSTPWSPNGPDSTTSTTPCVCSARPAFRPVPCSTPRNSSRTRPFTSAAFCRPWSIPMVRDFRMPAWPVRHNGHTAAVKPAPLLGEHTGEVLAGLARSERARHRRTRAGQGDSARPNDEHQATRKA